MTSAMPRRLKTSRHMCIVAVDYRVRGFTRGVKGKKYFIDHKINSIQNYAPEDTRSAYQMADVNLCQENLFRAKILLKGFKLENYLFGDAASNLSPGSATRWRSGCVRMLGIFYARNMPHPA